MVAGNRLDGATGTRLVRQFSSWMAEMKWQAKCHYKEERVPGEGGYFLSLPGPMEVCQGFQPPPTINPPPVDPKAEVWREFK
jgi:hypothetical protein